MNVLSAPATRWCALHNIQMIPNNPLIGLNFQQLHDFSGALGAAPMATKLSTAIAPGDTTDHGGRGTIEPGDRPETPSGRMPRWAMSFIIGTNPSESVRITAITQLASGQRDLDSHTRQPGEGLSRGHRRVGGLQSGISPDLLEVPQRPARAGHHESRMWWSTVIGMEAVTRTPARWDALPEAVSRLGSGLRTGDRSSQRAALAGDRRFSFLRGSSWARLRKHDQ